MKSYYRETAKMLINRSKKLYPRYFAPITQGVCEIQSFSFSSKSSLWGKIKGMFKKPEPVNIPEPITASEFTKTYTSFCGADIVVSFNDRVSGEVQGIMYHEATARMIECITGSDYYDAALVSEYPVTLVIDYTIFDQKTVYDKLKSATANEQVNITLSFMNEYGQAAMQSIFDVILLEDMSDINIDSVVLDGKMLCAARAISTMIKQ